MKRIIAIPGFFQFLALLFLTNAVSAQTTVVHHAADAIGLIFNARPDEDSFQINTPDLNQPSQILKIGDRIVNTNYKIVAFSAQTKPEKLVLEHIVTHARVVLELDKPAWVAP